MCRIMSVLQFFSTVSYRAVSYKKNPNKPIRFAYLFSWYNNKHNYIITSILFSMCILYKNHFSKKKTLY